MKGGEDERPSLPLGLTTWPRLYGAVLVHLLLWILLFIWLSEIYR
ncbi:MAG: hypothetical protein AAFU77_06370 [Myxococcota bacterium]